MKNKKKGRERKGKEREENKKEGKNPENCFKFPGEYIGTDQLAQKENSIY